MRCLALLALASALCAADAELLLNTGERIKGEVVKEDDASLVLRRRSLTPTGVQTIENTYAKDAIATRKELPSPLADYAQRAAKTPDEAMQQAALATWCADNCLEEQGVKHARRAEELDASNPFTPKTMSRLGYIKRDGAWVKESETLAKEGKVRVGNKVLTKEDAVRGAATAKAQMIRDQEAARVAELEADVKDASPEGIKKAEEAIASLEKQVESDRKRSTDTDKRLADFDKQIRERASNPQVKPNPDQAGKDQARRQELAKAAEEIRSKAAKGARELSSAKARLAALRSDAATIPAQLAAAKERLARAESDLAKAKGEAPAPGAAATAAPAIPGKR